MARGNLKKHDYVAAAYGYMDEHGLEALTMRSLGEKMSVDPTAVYRHFPTKDSLVNAVVDTFLGSVRETAASHSNDTPRDRIFAFALALREEFRRHPAIGVIIPTSSGGSENGYYCSRIVLEALVDMGLRGADLVTTYQMLEGYVVGACIQDFTGAPRNWDVRRARYRALDFPDIDAVAASSDDVRTHADTAYVDGVTILLDGALAKAAGGA